MMTGGEFMVSKAYSMGLFGMHAFLVEVEADLSQGLPAFDLVGLPDTAVKESRNRVRSALKNCGFDFPVSHITMNLAPADKRKEGPIYDLPIALTLLAALKQFKCPDFADFAMVGELALSGEVRRVRGVLPIALKMRDIGKRGILVPIDNAREASVVK
jgi:magnesium chelatase family protein